MSRIRVIDNIFKPPLLDTDSARVVEFYGGAANDELVALLIKGVLSKDLWGLVTKNDPDWYECLIRYGYKDANPAAVLEAMRNDKE